MSYQGFAYIYDQLMEDAPYQQWLQYIERLAKQHNHTIDRLLDLGCGTGSLAIPLAAQGKRVIGLDLSQDMLAVAEQKARQEGLAIQWLMQDMSKLELAGAVDTIICFCDSLNYLSSEQQVRETFQRVYHYLEVGGFFLFDVHSLYKLEAIFGNHTFAINDEQLSYIWQCYYDPSLEQVEHELSFFVPLENQSEDEPFYHRFDEYHVQKGYAIAWLRQWLEEAGFYIHEVTADFREESPMEQSERIFFAAQKR